MSFTSEELYQIRTVIREEVDSAVEPLAGQLTAVENDVREIYLMLKKAKIPATKVVYS